MAYKQLQNFGSQSTTNDQLHHTENQTFYHDRSDNQHDIYSVQKHFLL